MKNPHPVTGRTRLAFLFGHPVSHSLSPAMHNAAFARLGLDAVYVPLEVSAENVASAVETVLSQNVLGANVTVPYKEAVLPYLDRVEPEARWLRSVNTLYREGGKLHGDSTDGRGFLRSLGPELRRVKRAEILFVGAGGSARSVGGALAAAGAGRILILDVSPDRTQGLARLLRRRYPRLEAVGVSRKEAEKSMGRFSIILQATPVGLRRGDPSPVSLTGAHPGALAVDLIYHRVTAFQQEARRKRLRVLDGLGMLLHQGALSLERWTGRKAPVGVMKTALLQALGRRPA